MKLGPFLTNDSSRKRVFFVLSFLVVITWVFSGSVQSIGGLMIFPKTKEVWANAAFVGAGSCNVHNSSSCTANLGSSAAAGNLLVAFCGSRASVTLTNLSGYTLIRANESATPSLESWYKIADGSETEVTCTASTGSYVAGTILEYSGIDTSSPLDISATINGSGDTTAECPAVTPSSGTHLYVSGLLFNANGSFSSWSNSFFERVDTNTGAGNGASRNIIAAADKISTGSQSTVATADASGAWRCHSAAFNEYVNSAPTLSISQPDGTSDTVTVGASYNITYSLADTDNVVTAAFYYDTDNSGLNGTAISGACATAAEGSGATCSWNTTGVTPGMYYVYGIADDGVNSAVSAYSSGQITIDAPSNALPVASSVSIDSGASSVTLNEGTTKNVVCAGTVTDDNGYADITSVTADLFRTSVGIGSGLDDNDHYRLSGDSDVVPSGGSGNSETYTATFAVQYYADATDSGSPNESDTWTCTMTPSDAEGAGTSASDTIEMASLYALSVTSAIDYGTLDPDTDTGSTNQTTIVTNTGNRDMDPQVSGIDMSAAEGIIAVGQQKYSGSAFTYSSGGTALSTTPTLLNLTLPQRTSGEVTASAYWGIGVPLGTPSGDYSGTNTFTAVAGG